MSFSDDIQAKVMLATEHSQSLLADLLYKVSMRNSSCEVFSVCVCVHVRQKIWINCFILLHYMGLRQSYFIRKSSGKGVDF